MNEQTVRSMLGVSQKTMKTLREALRPGGFVERGREVDFTEQGLKEIEERTGVSLKKGAASQDAPGLTGEVSLITTRTESSEKEGAAAELEKMGAKEVAVVTNAFLRNGWLNPRLVSATVRGVAVRVRVKNGAIRMMRPGMQLEVKLVQNGLWECIQMPKAPGRVV